MTEFNLGKKIDKTFSKWTGGYVPSKAKKFNKEIKEDIKEFIRLLATLGLTKSQWEKVKKLAGSSFTELKGGGENGYRS